MINLVMKALLLSSLALLNYWQVPKNNELSVKIVGLKNIKGSILLEILSEKNKAVHRVKIPVKSEDITFKYTDLATGKYAIRLFHDINNNNKLDTNAFGLPKEPWGVSNNVPAVLGPPSFQKMLFDFSGNTLVKIQLR
jgi:uncharacterized protein (DUF2141 family)